MFKYSRRVIRKGEKAKRKPRKISYGELLALAA